MHNPTVWRCSASRARRAPARPAKLAQAISIANIFFLLGHFIHACTRRGPRYFSRGWAWAILVAGLGLWHCYDLVDCRQCYFKLLARVHHIDIVRTSPLARPIPHRDHGILFERQPKPGSGVHFLSLSAHRCRRRGTRPAMPEIPSAPAKHRTATIKGSTPLGPFLWHATQRSHTGATGQTLKF